MGLLDDVLGQGGGLGNLGQLARNPQVISAALALLNPKDPSVGGTSGLGGVLAAFTKAGLGHVVSLWVSTGPNPPVAPEQVDSALGPGTVDLFAQKAGLPLGEATSVLASVLPTLVDRLTPNGQVPAGNDLQNALGGLLSSLGGRA